MGGSRDLAQEGTVVVVWTGDGCLHCAELHAVQAKRDSSSTHTLEVQEGRRRYEAQQGTEMVQHAQKAQMVGHEKRYSAPKMVSGVLHPSSSRSAKLPKQI